MSSKRSRRRGQTPSLERRSRGISPRPQLWIYCEGKTEKRYLEDFATLMGNAQLKVFVFGERGVPRTVVMEARERKRALNREAKRPKKAASRGHLSSYDSHHEVWAVIDVDDHPKLNEALQMARDNDIGYALSNPCFELWILLHFKAQTAYIHRHDAQRELKALAPGYDHDKGATIDLTSLPEGGYEAAVKRAISLHARHISAGNAPLSNPSTTVWCLTEAIRTGSSEEAQKPLGADGSHWTGPKGDGVSDDDGNDDVGAEEDENQGTR